MTFEESLLESIDEVLSWLGESERQAVYFLLERKFEISRKEIPYRVADFVDAVENIFGLGAKVLEIRIMKCLFSKMGYFFPQLHVQDNLEFQGYIEAVRDNWYRLGSMGVNVVCMPQ